MSEEKKKVSEEDLEQINGGWLDRRSSEWFHYNKPEFMQERRLKGAYKK